MAEAQVLKPTSAVFQGIQEQGAGLKVEQPGLKGALRWDGSIAGGSLIHYTTTPVPVAGIN